MSPMMSVKTETNNVTFVKICFDTNVLEFLLNNMMLSVQALKMRAYRGLSAWQN